MRTIIHWLLSALAIALTAFILPGVSVSGLWTALIITVVLGLINIIIRPVLFILTLPINILTLGLFTFVINALLILLASKIVPGFQVTGFFPALFFAIVLSIVNPILHSITKKKAS
jgi:putative membrane protein